MSEAAQNKILRAMVTYIRGETFCSDVDSGDRGSVRYGFTTPNSTISKAYGNNVWGFVNKSYLRMAS